MKKQSHLRQLVKEEIANMTNESLSLEEKIEDEIYSVLQKYLSPQKNEIASPEIMKVVKKYIQRDIRDVSPFGENLNESENPIDCIKLDIPLFIRLLEYAREDAKNDIEIHDVAEIAISLSGTGKILTMNDYSKLTYKLDDKYNTIKAGNKNMNESDEDDELDYNNISQLEDELRRLIRWSNQYGNKGQDYTIKKLEDRIAYLKSNINESDEDDITDKEATDSAKNDKQYSTVNKAVKGLKQLEKEMKELATKYKAAEGKEKESIKNQLKDKTSQKKKIEAYIDKQTLEDDED